MRESNTPPLALAVGTTVNPMPEAVSRAGAKDHIPGLCFGVLSTPSSAWGVPVRVSCPGLGPAEMPVPKAGWACLWGNFYLHKQPLGGQLCPGLSLSPAAIAGECKHRWMGWKCRGTATSSLGWGPSSSRPSRGCSGVPRPPGEGAVQRGLGMSLWEPHRQEVMDGAR